MKKRIHNYILKERFLWNREVIVTDLFGKSVMWKHYIFGYTKIFSKLSLELPFEDIVKLFKI